MLHGSLASLDLHGATIYDHCLFAAAAAAGAAAITTTILMKGHNSRVPQSN
jgi:hypothetical protein